MLILYSNLIGQSVAELRSQSKLGNIADFIIDNDSFALSAAIVEINHLLFSERKIIVATDFVQILKDGLIVPEENVLIDLDESARVKNLYKRKCFGLNQKVETKSGILLGHVFDYMIDSTTQTIKKFYIKKMFKELIIPTSAIVSYEDRTITIKDDKNWATSIPAIETASPN